MQNGQVEGDGELTGCQVSQQGRLANPVPPNQPIPSPKRNSQRRIGQDSLSPNRNIKVVNLDVS
jgi:hypothetical protein